MRLIFLGSPGVGKGTQGHLISEYLSIPTISTGEVLREAVSNQTELGKKAQYAMEQGELVSDDLVTAIIADYLKPFSEGSGYLLDGFPRNINQANVLDNILSANGNQIDKVVLFTLPDDVLLRRLTGRRTCSKTGEILNIYFSSKEKLQACLDLGGTLIQRKDDQEEIISNRISVYKSETFPLINYYEEKNLLVKVNAESPVAMVHQELLSSLNLNCMS